MGKKLHVIVGHSDEVDISALTHELIYSCQKQLGGRSPKAGILFAGINLNHAYLLRHLTQTWPDMQLIGCTTDGEFSSSAGTLQDSAALLLLDSDTLEFSSGVIDQVNDVTKEGTAALVKAAHSVSSPPALGLLLADGLLFNVESLLEASQEAFGVRFPIFGGMAADQWQFKGTFQFYGSKILARQAPFLLIHGELTFASAIGTGWKAIGAPGIVTRAQGSVVHEIDYAPALDYFQKILGEGIVPSNELPLAVYDSTDTFQYLRTCFEKVDHSNGALTFAGAIPVGHKVRLTVVDRDSLINGVFSATRQAIQLFPSGEPPALALCFSCSARRALLGTRTEEEAKAVSQILGQGTPVIGFYTYGELAPSPYGQPSQVHNETFTVLLAS